MMNSINIIQIVLLAIMIFGVAFYMGKKIHLDVFPEDLQWINTSNMIFSLLTTLWAMYGVFHFHTLLSILPIPFVNMTLALFILTLPLFLLPRILRIIERNMYL